MTRGTGLLWVLGSVFLLLYFSPLTGLSAEGEEGLVFKIETFDIQGSSLIAQEVLQELVKPFTGPNRTVSDVEKARDTIEKYYHEKGYPAVLVNIPEQTIEEGVVRLQVIESRIGWVLVSGNRYYTIDRIKRALPSLQPGNILYLPEVQAELNQLNRNPNLKVEPVMSLGKEPGTVDIELRVKDRFPLHGSLELNNRHSHETKPLRLNAMIRYDNLWQRDHSVSLQYQISPQKTEQVNALSGSYVFPAFWEENHLVALFGIWSDSETAFGEGFRVTGKGNIFGLRYVVPLPPHKLYAHNITLGLDYKDFKESLGFVREGGGAIKTPLTYMPLSFAYSGSLSDEGGVTQLSAGLNLSFRGLVSKREEFEKKRYQGKANFLYLTAGIQRTQKLPLGMGLFLKADGQLANGPLVSTEQYAGGGMENVRGYKESEALGDHALHGTLEWSFPDPMRLVRLGEKVQMTPYFFLDAAKLILSKPLPQQERHQTLAGTGMGARGTFLKYFAYELDWAYALKETDRTKKDHRIHFKVKAQF